MKFKTVYGVDYSERGTVIVRAWLSGRQVRYARVTEIPAKDSGIVAASLATHEAFARRLTAPLASVEKARKVLPSLLDVQLPFPLEKCVYVFSDIASTAGGQTEALAAAARMEDIQSVLSRLNGAGFDPLQLDHEALALWTQSVDEAPPTGEELRAILYVGHDRSTLVLGRGQKFLAAQGSRQSAPEPTRLKQFLRTQLGQDADTLFSWAVVGPGATKATLDALKRPEETPLLKYGEPDSFLARALAARALTSGPLRCNLRIGPAEHPRIGLDRASAGSRAAIVCLAAGLMLCLLSVAWMQVLKQRNATAQRALTDIASVLAGMAVPKGQEVVVVQRQLDEFTPRAVPFTAMFGASSLDTFSRLLVSAASSDVRLSLLSLEGPLVELHGSAPNRAAGEALETTLAGEGWRVNLQRGEAGADERVPFTLKGEK